MSKKKKQSEKKPGAEASRDPGAKGGATLEEQPFPEDEPAGSEKAALPGAGEPAPAGEIEELEQELERARDEAKDASERALRTLAEFDNFRRRSERELRSTFDRGAADVLLDLLAVADDFDRALEHAGDDVPEAFLEGMRLVARGLHDLLDRKGVARIEAEGRQFDPERHEALAKQPVEGVEPNTVVQEIQVGYTIGDRVLRPTKVIVAAASPAGDGKDS